LLTEGAQYKWTYLLTYLKCIRFTKLLQGGQLGELWKARDRCRPQWQGGVATCNGKQKNSMATFFSLCIFTIQMQMT